MSKNTVTENDFNSVVSDVIRLTQYSHGAGCGCKISPKVLDQILHSEMEKFVDPHLLVGNESRDDAAVYDIGHGVGIISTTDFFMPIVDDPFDFGCIAATNAIYDVYAMGGTPLFALALVGMPVNTLPMDTIRLILEGGESVCAKAGIPIAGGHTIDSVEPIYGLVAIGLVHPGNVRRNTGAKDGDKLILGKGLGVGLYSAAFKKGVLAPQDYAAMIASTTQLNTPGSTLGCLSGVHAMTDVTGFGLLGHLVEICKGSGVKAVLDYAALPILPNALDYAARGCITGASARNWAGYGDSVVLDPERFGDIERALLTDPQTSGGLLISCAPEIATDVLSVFLQQGFNYASVIGEMVEGDPVVTFAK